MTPQLLKPRPVDAKLRLSEVLSAMSYALDITEGQPEGHAVRSCLIGLRIAEELGLPEQEKASLFYALLLKDLGCSSNAARMCWLFQADDRTVKHNIKLVDWSNMLKGLAFAKRHANPDGSFLERVLQVVGLAWKKEEAGRALIKVRCERGADITRLLGLPEDTAQAILALDEHWDGNGHPLGLKKQDIPLSGRICSLAQTMEVFVSTHGVRHACEIAKQRRRKWFDPELVDIFLAIARDPDFLETLTGPTENARAQLQLIEPEDHIREAGDSMIDRVALGFSQVIDAKSPWTRSHSEGVAEISVRIGSAMGFSREHQRELRRAGLLHDIGKLGVSNMILDKPGRLTDDEFRQMRLHSMHSQQILERVTAFHRFADYASAHHERLDGKGYHRGLAGDQIATEARILAVADVCEALAADRPYRDGMPPEKILQIIKGDSGTAFCPEVVDAFVCEADRIFAHLANR